MNLRIVSLSLVATALLTACDGKFERMVGLATPTPEPTPLPVPPTARATPKPGAWMWDKNRYSPLDQPARKR